jgi:hypothetical protein
MGAVAAHRPALELEAIFLIDEAIQEHCQPPIPTKTSHLFRLKPARHSDGSQPGGGMV